MSYTDPMNLSKKGAGIEEDIQDIQDSDNLAHELRSRLNTILGFSDILTEESNESLTSDQVDAIARIQNGSRALNESLAETLRVSKIGSTLAKEIALSEERVRNNQAMIRAAWAAIALLIGWSLASHQFLVSSSEDFLSHKLQFIEFRISDNSTEISELNESLGAHGH